MRVVEAYNTSGLHFTILPDRGLDVWTASYKGIPLTWVSQGSPHPPDYGQSWLRQFNGGLLTTCGLTHVGAPETDEQSGEQRDLHGNFTRLRAQDVRVEADGTTLKLHGTLAEAMLFGSQLRLERTYTLTLNEPGFKIEDTVTNLSDAPSPLMLVYHCNLGYPLIAAGTRLHTANVKVYPGTSASEADFANWPEYSAAVPGYTEQVFFHHPRADENGMTEAILYREEIGLAFRWDTRQMPYLTQWKNTRQGMYVCGVEPGNCIPEGQNAARRHNRLEQLAPGASRSFGCEIMVLDGGDQVAKGINRIYKIRESGQPATATQLDDDSVKVVGGADKPT
jgi:galactose mutarotase-like enzyme